MRVMCFAQENNESLSWDSNPWLIEYESDDLPTLVPIELALLLLVILDVLFCWFSLCHCRTCLTIGFVFAEWHVDNDQTLVNSLHGLLNWEFITRSAELWIHYTGCWIENSLYGLLNCELGELDCRVITT